MPDATVAHLSRAVDVLESEGVRFSDGGVHLQRPEPITGTVLHSEEAAASTAKDVGMLPMNQR